MRTSLPPVVAIVMLMVGATLILAPVISSCIFSMSVLQLLANSGLKRLATDAPGMQYGYQWACMAVGTLLIALGVNGSRIRSNV